MTGDITLDGAERAAKSHDAAALSCFREAISMLAQRLELVRVKP